MNKYQSKIKSIVLLRGIAAIAVCLVHLQMFTNFHAGKLIDWIINNGQQGVTIFFVISGFIQPYSLHKKNYEFKDIFKFLAKRSLRVDPPYWASIVLLFMSVSLPISILSFKNIFFHITYLIPFTNINWFSGVYWTLAIEFQFYILIGICYPFLVQIGWAKSVVCLAIISLIGLKYNDRGIIIGYFYQFSFGYLAFMAYTQKANFKKCLIIIIAFALYIALTKSITSGIIPAITTLIILMFKNEWRSYFFLFLGDISYSLYLTHIPIGTCLIKFSLAYTSNPTILFILSIIVCTLFAYLFFIFVEKPSVALSKRIWLNHTQPDKK